ncbi:glycosyltransferase family 10 [Martelella sp. HB161492]|uniref:glycosyltransferase family 10 domain-containing protein n=1 Tax=Martelella sp. HB161492 TaxID=2720726 RepID=UPI001FEE6308|nr:glycosyltransferase family 10 [Martelella sp. HB161492]
MHDNRPIRIKFVVRGPMVKAAQQNYSRQLRRGFEESRGVQFILDSDAPDYDWLVVYDDLPVDSQDRRLGRSEQLPCPPANTLLLTSEPSAIRIYSRSFLRQFGHVLTSQEPFALRHDGRIWSQVGLFWYYGTGGETALTADMIANSFPEKSQLISTVCSTKRQGHTLHRLRYDFTEFASKALPEMEVYGHGRRPMRDKAEALDPFKYHLAIENHVAQHHITEKLSDAFLGLSLPFYFGAPNAADYFPEDSFIALDIRKPDEAVAIMKAAIADHEYEKRLPAIIEARRRVIEDYNCFTRITDIVTSTEPPPYIPAVKELKSHRAARIAAPVSSLADIVFRETLQLKNRIANMIRR